jgi:arylsulfatase A-like enzyme
MSKITTTESRPNVVYIVADDMGYGDFGVFNDGITSTPAINALVDSGICLTQHYSASPVCAPARAGLFTGRYPHRTGVIDTYETLGLDRMRLDEVTVMDAFRSGGYRTGLVGKWHCGAMDRRYHPTNRGVDEFIGFSGGWADYYQWQIERNGTREASDGTYLTDKLTDEAIGFITRNRTTPFFLHLAYNAPHFPMQAPQEDVARYAGTGKYTTGVSTVYAMISRMDAGIGRILEALKLNGLDENTIVVFTSDNGPDFGGEGDDCLQRFNCNYRGAKTLVYEGGIRVPAIVRWPAGVDSGAQCGEIVHMTDWFPTLLSACDLPVPSAATVDGVDILPLLRGDGETRSGRRIYWQWNRFTPFVESNAAVRDGKWKLVQPAVPSTMPPNDPQHIIDMDVDAKYDSHGAATYRPEMIPAVSRPVAEAPLLFNLEEDPEERHNLAESNPDVTRKLLGDLLEWFNRVELDRARPADPGPAHSLLEIER